MIPKIIALLVCAAVLYGFFGFGRTLDPKEFILSRYESFVSALGHAALTPEFLLEGERSFGEDGYVGGYCAELKGKTGEETVFGGTSTEARRLRLLVYIKTESGSAKVKLIKGEKTETVYTDVFGGAEISAEFFGGSNYIAVDYESFVGSVSIISSYE